jgi:hypothetical protein
LKSEGNGPGDGGDGGTSAIWPGSWDSANRSPSSISMLDVGAGIVGEGDQLPEPTCEVLGEGEMADSSPACIGNPGEGGLEPPCASEVLGEGEEHTNPTRRLASLSR